MHLFRRRNYAVPHLFNGAYMDTKVLYALQFGGVPSVLMVGQIDVNRAFEYIRSTMNSGIVDFLQYAHFAHEDRCSYFTSSVFVLSGGRIIELGPGYAGILHGRNDFGWAREVATAFSAFRLVEEPVGASTIGFTVSATMN